LTNSFFSGNVNITMFATKFIAGFKQSLRPNGLKREKRIRARRVIGDAVTEQVRQVLQTADQKLILMVRN
jgi:hypothetical protein